MQRQTDHVPFAHAESDKDFSAFWHGHPEAFERKDFPEWIKLCDQMAYHFDSGNYLTYPVELANFYGLSAAGSDFINHDDSCYLREIRNNDRHEIVSEQEYKKRRSDLVREIENPMWSWETLTKLIKQYLKYYHESNRGSMHMHHMLKKIVDEFLKNLINDVINPIVFEANKHAHRITVDDRKYEALVSELCLFVLHLNSATPDCVHRHSQPDMVDDERTDDGETQSLIKVDNLASTLLHGTYVPETDGMNEAVSPKRSTIGSKSRTSLLFAAGAIAGVIILAMVIAATHGVALPFIAGVGATILAGHGGAIAGMALGMSVFGLSAAAVGAAVSYAAKKMVDGVSYFCKPAEKPEHKHLNHSPSTASLISSLRSQPSYDSPRHSHIQQKDDQPHSAEDESKHHSVWRTAATLFGCCGPQATLIDDQYRHEVGLGRRS